MNFLNKGLYMNKQIIIFAILLAFSNISHAALNNIKFPEGYRNWVHIKSMIIEPGHALENPFQGIHHIYANPKALKGFKSGNFKNGSIIVFDLLKYNSADKTIQEGERKLIGIMNKDSTKFASTGGWGFEGFAGNSKTERLVSDGGKSCFECHASQKDNDYVYSKYRN
jgi:hypothetical protein